MCSTDTKKGGVLCVGMHRSSHVNVFPNIYRTDSFRVIVSQQPNYFSNVGLFRNKNSQVLLLADSSSTMLAQVILKPKAQANQATSDRTLSTRSQTCNLLVSESRMAKIYVPCLVPKNHIQSNMQTSVYFQAWIQLAQ